MPLNIPLNCLDFKIAGNTIEDVLPTLPLTLERLVINDAVYLKTNKISGSNRLTRPREIKIANSYITNIDLSDASFLDSNMCDISSNPLLGNPSILNLNVCIQTGLYANTVAPDISSTTALSTTIQDKTIPDTQSLTSTFVSTSIVDLVTTESIASTKSIEPIESKDRTILDTERTETTMNYSSELIESNTFTSSMSNTISTASVSNTVAASLVSTSTKVVSIVKIASTRLQRQPPTTTSIRITSTVVDSISSPTTYLSTSSPVDPGSTTILSGYAINNQLISITPTNYFYMIKIIIDATLFLVMLQTHYMTVKHREFSRRSQVNQF